MRTVVVYDATIMDSYSGHYLAERTGLKGNSKQLSPRERSLRICTTEDDPFCRYKRTLSEKKACRFYNVKFPLSPTMERVFKGYCGKYGTDAFLVSGNINSTPVLHTVRVKNGEVTYERVGQKFY